MKPNWNWMPWMAFFSVLFFACPGMGLSKETEGLLNKALKDSEKELKTLQLARAKDRKKTLARTLSEPATEAR